MTIRDSIESVRRLRSLVGSGATTGEIENPVTGERIEFRNRQARSPEATLRLDYTLEPGGFAVGGLDHVHPRQTERIDVRSGRLGVRVGGDEWTATPGTRFAVPPKTPHTLWNDGDDPVHATIELSPALDSESFFRTIYGLARDGRTNRWGLPGPLQSAVLLDEFREEFAFAAVPIVVQRLVAGIVAPVGRLVGYRAHNPE